jgi:hypothetical protein
MDQIDLGPKDEEVKAKRSTRKTGIGANKQGQPLNVVSLQRVCLSLTLTPSSIQAKKQ